MTDLSKKSIIFGVSGGIAAYRSLELIRLLKTAGANIRVMPTRNALQFIGGLSFEAISGQTCYSDPLTVNSGQISHIEEAAKADAIIIAPATCDIIARMAHGLADELILQTLLSFRGPCLIAPAMESQMWEHAATQYNVELLKERGCTFVGPNAGPLASGRTGIGRMAEPSEIFEHLLCALATKDFVNQRVLVTAGPTIEDIDPVRFISNRSSGKMGVALARALAQRGAQVLLVHGPMMASPPNLPNIRTYPVRSASQMFDQVMELVSDFDMAILCAAVADFTPSIIQNHKIKKSSIELTHLPLSKTKDILNALGQRKPKPFLIGFAAETKNLEEEAFRKCIDKNCDLICGNLVIGEGSTFESEFNQIIVVDRNKNIINLHKKTKSAIAHNILDVIHTRTSISS